MFLTYATAAGATFLDRELYLPKGWTENRARCALSGIGEDVGFASTCSPAPGRWVARFPAQHLHVLRREDNPNGAWAKSRRPRTVPLDFLTVQAFDTYAFERMRVPVAADGDFVVVNLFRAPLCVPMRPDAIGELLAAASRRAGLGRRCGRINSGMPSAVTPPMPGAVLTWSLTCSVTPLCLPRRCICIRTRPGCELRWTWCLAHASTLG